jgi:nitrate reductase gamma subunit
MNMFYAIAGFIGLAGAVVGIIGIIKIILDAQRQPYTLEVAPPKESPRLGVLYAFTLGMAPWAKESVRIHWLAYLRGILFHVCIFMGAVWIIISPWSLQLILPVKMVFATLLGFGAIMGFTGFYIRLKDSGLRYISTPDDYFALGIVSLFLSLGAVSALIHAALPYFWILCGLILAYIPFGKLRHFVYFFYARVFLGTIFGRRGAFEL